MPTPPTQLDHFFANYHYQIIGFTFLTQIFHHQLIKRSEASISPSTLTTSASSASAQSLSSLAFRSRPSGFPRLLRAGLGWGAVCVVLMTKSTIAKRAVRDYKCPVIERKAGGEGITRGLRAGM